MIQKYRVQYFVDERNLRCEVGHASDSFTLRPESQANMLSGPWGWTDKNSLFNFILGIVRDTHLV